MLDHLCVWQCPHIFYCLMFVNQNPRLASATPGHPRDTPLMLGEKIRQNTYAQHKKDFKDL